MDSEGGQCDHYAGDQSSFPQHTAIMRNRTFDQGRAAAREASAKGKQIGRKATAKDDIPAFFYKHLGLMG